MKVRFWGVRGSIPVPGRATNRYGGNTSCVEVRPQGRRADHHRRRHRPAPARQVADGGGVRRRPGQGLDPDQPHALGSRAGPAVLLAAVPRRQPDPHLRAPARHAPRGRVLAAARRAVLPGAAVGDAGRHAVPRADRGRAVRDRQARRSRARGSTTRGSRSRTAIDVDGASVVYCSDTAPFTDILLGREFIVHAAVARRAAAARRSPPSSRRCAPAWSRSRRTPTC